MSKTIFNIIQSNNSGGMENVFLDYSQILAQNNFKVIAITSGNFVHLQELKSSQIPVEILNIRGHFDFFSAVKLYFLIKKYSPDLIMAHNGRAFATINLLGKFFNFKNIKLLAVSHGGSIKRILKFDYIIAVAGHIYQKIIAQKFSGKVKVIYNGIKIISYQKNKKNSDEAFNFGMMSRLSPEKNIEIAIVAFAEFSSKVKNSTLIIAGEGQSRCALEGLVDNLNIKDQVKFIGWIKDKKTFFDQIDVFLQPSANEPFGLTILEAFNYKTPVIAANTHGPKEIIKNNITGCLFEPGSSELLFLAMIRLYENAGHRQEITNAAYQDLITDFSHEEMARNLIDFVRDCFS